MKTFSSLFIKLKNYINKFHEESNKFQLFAIDDLAIDRCHLLRPAYRFKRRDEHQRRSVHFPQLHDFPERLRRY